MAKTCPHCGETSDRDDLCTWCNKSLTPAKQAGAPAAAPAAKPAVPAARPGAAPAAGAPSVRRTLPTVEQPRALWPYIIGALVAVVVILFLAGFVAAKTAAGPPPEPQDWKTVESKTKLFSVSVPGNYLFSTSGSAGTYEQFTVKGTKLCRVYVDGTGTKGAMSDTAAAAARVSGGDSSPNVADHGEGKFHASQGDLAKRKDPVHKEEGEMQAWSFAGMPAAYSEYTTVKKVGLFGVKMKGWRISCMGGDFGYQVWAEAPEAQWEKFEPIARKILEGVTQGKTQ
jgi:hypothetical protein